MLLNERWFEVFEFKGEENLAPNLQTFDQFERVHATQFAHFDFNGSKYDRVRHDFNLVIQIQAFVLIEKNSKVFVNQQNHQMLH